jgi:hypothetical protein
MQTLRNDYILVKRQLEHVKFMKYQKRLLSELIASSEIK